MGNKIDLNHKEEVAEDVAKEFANKNGMKLKCVSAMTGFRVEEMFVDIGNEYLKKMGMFNEPPRNSTYIRKGKNAKKKKGCC